MTTNPPPPDVLIHTHDAVIAALLGALCGDQSRVMFPSADELPAEAVRRIRPRLVIAGIGESDEIADAAREVSATVLCVGNDADCAQRGSAGGACFGLPGQQQELRHAIARALGRTG